MESCPSGRRCSTRKLRCTLEARKPVSLEIAGHPIWSRYRIPAFSPLFFSPVSSRKPEGDVEVNHHGELSEWSKVQHSKCCEESNPPRVRIPDSPPQSSAEAFCRALFVLISHAEGRFRTDCIASAEVSFDSYSKCAYPHRALLTRARLVNRVDRSGAPSSRRFTGCYSAWEGFCSAQMSRKG